MNASAKRASDNESAEERVASRADANGTVARSDRREALAHGERDVTGDRARGRVVKKLEGKVAVITGATSGGKRRRP
jgi:hypothetical protein